MPGAGIPDEWPGERVLEGRTIHHLPPATGKLTDEQLERHGKGPASKEHRTVFHNPAMAGCRTRSVLLLDHMMQSGWLGPDDRPVRALDALCASGIRARRWANELPQNKMKRLEITATDLDGEALQWAIANSSDDDIHFREGDVRQIMLEAGWQWIDIDPYGSPVRFLDSALQSTGRRSVMEITATDTAALTGSSSTACLRRYGARIRTDDWAHDSGLRLLLATVAKTAATHDRNIEPLLSSWDSHHLRISIRVIRSIEGANTIQDKLGWRVVDPSPEELIASCAAGLHPNGDAYPQPQCLLPMDHPVDASDKRFSGPLWVGPLHDAQILDAMTEERALELCWVGKITKEEGLIENPRDSESIQAMNWKSRDLEYARRAIIRSVKGFQEEAELADVASLIITDSLPAYGNMPGPPSIRGFVDRLIERGYRAAVARWEKPAIRTDAPWPVIIEVAESSFD
ncbi:MAG: hypothetical protein QGF94_05145 [Candidatus Thalassarchaeaceae archaeon]|jgi:tRNA (guanine26-N2/guanine27-N2)-dimethyltransferase|nr:hypothetical protein [Candidatus Thalassarchaeaceae archaeon]